MNLDTNMGPVARRGSPLGPTLADLINFRDHNKITWNTGKYVAKYDLNRTLLEVWRRKAEPNDNYYEKLTNFAEYLAFLDRRKQKLRAGSQE